MIERPTKLNAIELNKSIHVETAKDGAVAEIATIALEVKIDPKNIDPEKAKGGFLIYNLDENDYKKRLNLFFLTFSEENKVRGFIMSYDKTFLEQLIKNGEIAHEDGIMQYLQTEINPADNFIFGDQIAISKDNRNREAGTKLMKATLSRMQSMGINNMYVAILHQPIRNEASINFVGRFGFNHTKEVTNSDGLVWGIYHLNIEPKK
ncbi:GNAT family N-acetyltransferase [Candidatus Kuenenbacteria bacterium]|nr:GNAT family N-acetyltransferase [Candidatus Kuenenbacteria bacterium]